MVVVVAVVSWCVCVCVCVCLCFRRLKLKTKFPHVFELIKPRVDMMLMSEWRRVMRFDDPIEWVSSRLQVCALLMDEGKLNNIITAGDHWRTRTQDLADICGEGSVLASSLFSQCVADSVEANVATVFSKCLGKLCESKPAHGAKLDQKAIDKCKGEMLREISHLAGQGLQHTTSKSDVCVDMLLLLCCCCCCWCVCMLHCPLQVWTPWFHIALWPSSIAASL